MNDPDSETPDFPAQAAGLPGAPQTAGRQLKQERGVETQDKLVQAAIDLLTAEGYANFSTPNVARYAGVSRGALQYHFESRDALMIAVRTRLAAAMQEKAAWEDLVSLSAKRRIDKMIAYYWDVISSQSYIAAIEIRLYERFNAELNKQMLHELRQITTVRDRTWRRVFHDSPLPAEDLIAIRRFMLDVMRGLAIRQIETRPAQRFDKELTLLRRMLQREIWRK